MSMTSSTPGHHSNPTSSRKNEILFRRKGDNLCRFACTILTENVLRHLSPNYRQRIRWGYASTGKKRTGAGGIGGRNANCRPNLDQRRDLSRNEALAGVPDGSRLPRTVHGIGVQLHSCAAASCFRNPADAAE